MLHVVEVGPQVNVDDSRLDLHNCLGHSGYHLMRCPFRSVSSFVRYPYGPGWKSASKIVSRMSLTAPWTTRSRIEGIERTRTLVPPSFGISFFRARMGRYVLETNSSLIC